MDADHAVASGIQRRNHLERHSEHTREPAGDWICFVSPVFCDWRHENMWVIRGSEEAGTRFEAVYSLCYFQGSYHLWTGTDAGISECHSRSYRYHNERGWIWSGI